MSLRTRTTLPVVVLVAFMAAGLALAAEAAPTSLKEAYKGDFVVGAAINAAQITGADTRGDALIEAQFNSISPENILKWEVVHPQPGKYDFSLSDQYVAFGEKHKMFIVGHNLVWHNQVPDSVPRRQGQSPLPRRSARAVARPHR